MAHEVEPEVFLLAASTVDGVGLNDLMIELDAPTWESDAPEGGSELLTEICGRLCYKSFGTSLNPNLSMVREGNELYIGNILKVKHGSVLEHGSATFVVIGGSRIFTHEQVRHRAGAGYSQESMRFVRMDDLGYYNPKAFSEEALGEVYQHLVNNDPEFEGMFFDEGPLEENVWVGKMSSWLMGQMWQAFAEAEGRYSNIVKRLDMDSWTNFDLKKKYTSALRRMIPDGVSTNIAITANHRAWRHMLEMRTAKGAEEEIRLIFDKIGNILLRRFPNIYQDFTKVADPYGIAWIPSNSKV